MTEYLHSNADKLKITGAINRLQNYQLNAPNTVSRTRQDKDEEIISVQDFGVVVGTDNDYSTEFQNGINELATAGGGRLLLPGRVYAAGMKITTDNIVIAGNSMNSRIMPPSDTSATAILTVEGISRTGHILYTGLENVLIDGEGVNIRGIEWINVGLSTMYNVEVKRCSTAFYFEEVWDSWFYALTARSCTGNGIDIRTGIFDNSNNMRFYGSHLESLDGYYVYIYADKIGNNHIIFDHPKIEIGGGLGKTGIKVEANEIGDSEDIQIINGLLSGFDNAIHWTGWGYLDVVGTAFWRHTLGGTAIKIDDGRARIRDNIFYNQLLEIDTSEHPTERYVWIGADNRRKSNDGRIAHKHWNQTGDGSLTSWIKSDNIPGRGLFVDGDTTPSIALYNKFETQNTTTTIITRFDDVSANEEFVVYIPDAFTVIKFESSAQLRGNGGSDLYCKQGTTLHCKSDQYDNLIYVWTNSTTLYTTFAYNFPSIAAGAISSVVTTTLTGIKPGDHVDIACIGDTGGMVPFARCDTDDQVKWFLWNPTAGAVDLGNVSWRLTGRPVEHGYIP